MLDLRDETLFDFSLYFPNSPGGGVNKAELVDAVREAAGLERRQAESAVEAVMDAIVSSVKGGERVSIPRFGTFNQSSRAARTGRNPQTGAPVKIAASKGVRFAPASAFKEALNAKKGAAAKKAAPAKAGASKKAAPAKKAAKSSSTSKKAAPAKKAAKSTKKR
jgi:DNA-binding protein HU-beta